MIPWKSIKQPIEKLDPKQIIGKPQPPFYARTKDFSSTLKTQSTDLRPSRIIASVAHPTTTAVFSHQAATPPSYHQYRVPGLCSGHSGEPLCFPTHSQPIYSLRPPIGENFQSACFRHPATRVTGHARRCSKQIQSRKTVGGGALHTNSHRHQQTLPTSRRVLRLVFSHPVESGREAVETRST